MESYPFYRLKAIKMHITSRDFEMVKKNKSEQKKKYLLNIDILCKIDFTVLD